MYQFSNLPGALEMLVAEGHGDGIHNTRSTVDALGSQKVIELLLSVLDILLFSCQVEQLLLLFFVLAASEQIERVE